MDWSKCQWLNIFKLEIFVPPFLLGIFVPLDSRSAARPKLGLLFGDFSLKISFLSGQLQAMIMRCTEPFVGLGILMLVLGWLIGDTSISTSNSHEVFMCPILSNLVKRGETKWCT